MNGLSGRTHPRCSAHRSASRVRACHLRSALEQSGRFHDGPLAHAELRAPLGGCRHVAKRAADCSEKAICVHRYRISLSVGLCVIPQTGLSFRGFDPLPFVRDRSVRWWATCVGTEIHERELRYREGWCRATCAQRRCPLAIALLFTPRRSPLSALCRLRAVKLVSPSVRVSFSVTAFAWRMVPLARLSADPRTRAAAAFRLT